MNADCVQIFLFVSFHCRMPKTYSGVNMFLPAYLRQNSKVSHLVYIWFSFTSGWGLVCSGFSVLLSVGHDVFESSAIKTTKSGDTLKVFFFGQSMLFDNVEVPEVLEFLCVLVVLCLLKRCRSKFWMSESAHAVYDCV